MIVSASRRTDIPAIYPEWLLHRLACGFAEVANPFRPSQVRRVDLRPPPAGDLDLLVLWTRNPARLVPSLGDWLRKGVHTLWLVTITGYPSWLEPGAPPPEQALAAVRELSAQVGREVIGWRYDPILLAPDRGLDCAFHRDNFQRLARRLAPYVGRCIVSTCDPYAKTRKRLAGAGVHCPAASAYLSTLETLARLGRRYGLDLQTCAQPPQTTAVPPAACIDPTLVNRLWNLGLPSTRDRGQRRHCHCAPSVDIGCYDTCTHGCLYCYATGNPSRVAQRVGSHRPQGTQLV